MCFPKNNFFAALLHHTQLSCCLFCIFIYIFLERGEGREKERERNANVREKYQSVASRTCPNQELNPQRKHVPDLELTQKIFALRVTAHSTEAHQSGHTQLFVKSFLLILSAINFQFITF